MTGLDAGLMHMQHIHGIGLSQCPTADADTSGDGLISLEEGLPAYGPVVVPLTQANDPTMYPTASLRPGSPANFTTGGFVYKRIFVIGQDIPVEVANALEDHQVVVHGIDVNGNGVYEGEEELLPAACGTLSELTGASAWSALVLDRYARYPPPAVTTPAPATPAPTVAR